MKKYVYSKGQELVSVETDGLGVINNFMVTGLIGTNYSGLVSAGLNFQMGMAVSINEMLNVAKLCACKLQCFEGNELIVDESVDYSGGTPPYVGEVSGLQLKVAFNKATYESAVPEKYQEDYPYEDSKEVLPWLVATFQRIGAANETMQVQVFANERHLEYRTDMATVGTLSPDRKTLTTKVTSYLMFDIVRDLGIVYPKEVTWFRITVMYGGKTFDAKLFITPGTI